MTPLKDTLEAANPAGEATATQGSERTKSDAGQLRSDAVSLDVPVKVHGSRVTEVVRGATPHTEPFEEQTATMIVFPQGGVIKMSAPVTVGQMVVLTNLKSGHDAICRVVKVRAFAKSQSYVEIEFTNRQQGYWGVYFPSEGADHAQKVSAPVPSPVSHAAAPAAPNAGIERVAHPQAPVVSRPPAPSSQLPTAKPASAPAAHATHASKPESSFVGIGSQEEVQPSASAMGGRKKDSFAAPVAPLSMTELRGDAHAAPPVSLGAGVPGEGIDLSQAPAEAVEEDAPATFGRFAASASLGGSHAATRQPFGAHFEAVTLGVAAPSAESPRPKAGTNWVLIAASVVILFVLVAGGIFYFRVWPVRKAAVQSIPAVATPSAPIAETNAVPAPVLNPPAQTSMVNPPAAASAPVVAARVADATPPKPIKAPPAAPVQPKPAVSQKAQSIAPDISASLSAHPQLSQRMRSGEGDAAPSIDAGTTSATENNALAGIAATSVAAPPPPQPDAATAPIRVGGDVKPPRLVSTVLPVYPTMAKTAGVEGRVVIETSIQTDGSVKGSKVVSGPPMLRQAALDALRRWKYAPGMLNGEPVPVQITVTIEFHR
ncbi:MAG TPA: TonB family protein [Candidatus Acidoferrales bacterium]|nr:TonB family protein [Candidatus Acidoferrales bacterium]